MKHAIFTYALACVLSLVAAQAAVPGLINYQGRLTDSNGDPVTGSKTLAVAIYDAASGGNLLYSEIIGAVTLDANGVYSFQFGSEGDGVAAALAGAAEHWLELSVDGVQQATRDRVLAVPFAQVAGTVPDGAITSSKLAPGAAAANLEAGGLRIVRGSGAADGTLLQGEGFTVVHTSGGQYAVTFDVAFQSNPTVVATPHGEGTIRGNAGTSILSLTPNGFVLRVWEARQYYSLPVNAAWHFIAIGQ